MIVDLLQVLKDGTLRQPRQLPVLRLPRVWTRKY